MKRTALALTLIFALLAVAGTQFVNLGRANPLPPMYTEITIEKPLNTTYNVNTVSLFFSVDTDWSLNSYFYSLDGQERKPVENIVTILQEDINAGKNPQIIRTVLNGSCNLSNLSEGWHNVTVYQISHLIGGDPEYEIPFSKSIQFKIETAFPTTEPEPFQTSEPEPVPTTPSPEPQQSEPFPTTLVAVASGVSIAIIGTCLLVYFKKRQHQTEMGELK